MAVEARIRELGFRHQNLDRMIEEETNRPAADATKLKELKLKKLSSRRRSKPSARKRTRDSLLLVRAGGGRTPVDPDRSFPRVPGGDRRGRLRASASSRRRISTWVRMRRAMRLSGTSIR